MEIIALIIALAAIFAVKTVSILHWQDEEVAKSTTFSWTKPGARDSITVPEFAVEQPEVRRAPSEAWKPSLAGKRVAMAR